MDPGLKLWLEIVTTFAFAPLGSPPPPGLVLGPELGPVPYPPLPPPQAASAAVRIGSIASRHCVIDPPDHRRPRLCGARSFALEIASRNAWSRGISGGTRKSSGWRAAPALRAFAFSAEADGRHSAPREGRSDPPPPVVRAGPTVSRPCGRPSTFGSRGPTARRGASRLSDRSAAC